jgi:5S rRNA maturation endonuclease (ribonuclease M5)
MAVVPNLLIVEGKDDLHVMRALRDKLNMKGVYEVSTRAEGKTENVDTLINSISIDVKTSGRVSLGVIVDKDSDDPGKNKDYCTR